MTALAQDKDTERKEGVELPRKVAASTKIYGGALTMFGTDGYIIPGADTASCKFAGIAKERYDNSSGADGDIDDAITIRTGVHKMACTGMAITDIGAAVFLIDDQTVGLAATTTNDVACGKIAEFHSATSVGVDITGYC